MPCSIKKIYENLVGIKTRQSDSELRQIDEQKYTDLIRNQTIAGDPLISSKIDLQQILFRTATTLMPEEEIMPDMLRTKTGEQHDATIQANAMKTWHQIIHYDIDPQKIRPFLAFRPIETIIKTLANTTQHARKMSKLGFLFSTPKDLMKKSPQTNYIQMQ